MCDGSKVNCSAQRGENRNLVDEKNVDGQRHLTVKIPDFFWYMDGVCFHRSGLVRTVFPFNAAMLRPHILYATIASDAVTGQSLI